MRTKILGILNVTPDSSYDGGHYYSFESAIARGLQMEKEGADWVDVGGESTRPDALPVHEAEELRRVIPVIKELVKNLKIPISIDTRKAKVAEAALNAGAKMINDISGLASPEMVAVARNYQVPVCIMHMQGTPETMQLAPSYPEGVTHSLIEWFKTKIDRILKAGIQSSQIILDPGIGFGKTVAHNLEILHNLPQFGELGFPLLLGLSRKSFMMKYLEKSRNELLAASLAVNSYAVLHNVEFLRVHDVECHRDAIRILEAVKKIK